MPGNLLKNLEKSWKCHGILSVRKSGNPEHFNCNLSFVWRVLIIIKIYLQFFSVSRLIAAADLDLLLPTCMDQVRVRLCYDTYKHMKRNRMKTRAIRILPEKPTA